MGAGRMGAGVWRMLQPHQPCLARLGPHPVPSVLPCSRMQGSIYPVLELSLMAVPAAGNAQQRSFFLSAVVFLQQP